MHWSGPSRTYELRDRPDRARVYEVVLREGTETDMPNYIDGSLLVDAWAELVLPAAEPAPDEDEVAHPRWLRCAGRLRPEPRNRLGVVSRRSFVAPQPAGGGVAAPQPVGGGAAGPQPVSGGGVC